MGSKVEVSGFFVLFPEISLSCEGSLRVHSRTFDAIGLTKENRLVYFEWSYVKRNRFILFLVYCYFC